MIWTPRRRGLAIFVLTVMIVVLTGANLVKAKALRLSAFASYKDVLAAASSLTNICVLLVGGVLAYFRFFRGRTLAVRGDLSLAIQKIDTPDGSCLHAITLQMRNIGTVAIWDPVPRMEVYTHGPEGFSQSQVIDNWYEWPRAGDGRKLAAVIDSGENSYFFVHETFSPKVWAVTYMATVTCDTGDIWKCVATTANSARRADGEPHNTPAATDAPRR